MTTNPYPPPPHVMIAPRRLSWAKWEETGGQIRSGERNRVLVGLTLSRKLAEAGSTRIRAGTDALTLVGLLSYFTYVEAALILRSIRPMSVSRPLLRFSYSRTLLSSSAERTSSRSEISATFISS